jgi:ABC-type amino acid transport substrate-binding protein
VKFERTKELLIPSSTQWKVTHVKESVYWCTALVLFFAGISQAAGIVRIGVLAKNGLAKALKKWQATSQYLTTKIEGKSFEIVPLGFDKVFPAIKDGKVDFFLINSSKFVTAKVKYGAVPILT